MASLEFRVEVCVPLGGRRVWSGLRPACWLGHTYLGHPAVNGSQLVLEGVQFLDPGETGVGMLTPTDASRWLDVSVDRELELFDGERLFVTVRVLEVCSKGLTKP